MERHQATADIGIRVWVKFMTLDGSKEVVNKLSASLAVVVRSLVAGVISVGDVVVDWTIGL